MANMNQEFRRPEFLHKEVEVRPFAGGEFLQGTLTRVARLEDLPASVRERAKDGLVVKEYRYSEGDPYWDQLLEGDKSFEHPSEKKLTEIGRRMTERQAIVKNYFQNVLPDLVVPTQFIVGARAGGGKDAKRLYEIQQMITPAVAFDDKDVRYAWMYMQNDPHDPFSESGLENLLEGLSYEMAEKIYRELPDANRRKGLIAQIEILVARGREFVAETGWIPYDLFKTDNLLITKDGLRLIDTNMGVSAAEYPNWIAVFNRGVKFWEAVARHLAAAGEQDLRKAA